MENQILFSEVLVIELSQPDQEQKLESQVNDVLDIFVSNENHDFSYKEGRESISIDVKGCKLMVDLRTEGSEVARSHPCRDQTGFDLYIEAYWNISKNSNIEEKYSDIDDRLDELISNVVYNTKFEHPL